MMNFTKNSPHIMGVVNVTPDSFSDGGDFIDPHKAIEHGLKLLAEGADILDIGGESTRPGAQAVTPEQEQQRVLPVIEGLKKIVPECVISVDTRHSDTMQKSIELGADIINDISALTHDAHSVGVVSKAQVPVILMHMKGTPETMQGKPKYEDVVEEIYDYLKARIDACEKRSIARHNIIIDPGIGFGKTLEDNLKILKNLDKFQNLGAAVLLGASRKSFIEKICFETPVDQRLAGSIAAAIKGLQQGVQIFRVHDVAETKQAFTVWQAMSEEIL